jgi:hypothetical protein
LSKRIGPHILSVPIAGATDVVRARVLAMRSCGRFMLVFVALTFDEALRAIRTSRVLEWAGTPQARELLRKMAAWKPGTSATN